MTEVLVYTPCLVLTEKCELVTPIRHDGKFDVYDLEANKHYWVGCGKFTYKILVNQKGFEIVEVSPMTIDNFCSEVFMHD